jgi:hypothetical protein
MIYPEVKYLGPAHSVPASVTVTRTVAAFPVPIRARKRALEVVRQPRAYAASQRFHRVATSRPADWELPLAA